MRNTLLTRIELILLGAVILAAAANLLAAKIELPLWVTIALGVVALVGLVLAAPIRRSTSIAIAGYTRAIRLASTNADKAKAYNNRGLARAAKGDQAGAIA